MCPGSDHWHYRRGAPACPCVGQLHGGAAGTLSDMSKQGAGPVQVSDRLEALDAATRAIAGVLDIDTVLQCIADSVRTLVSAEHAALGVVDATGRMELFITSGISREERERIGALPRGRGLLGLIIRAGRSYRIADISDHPDSYGFPPNYPPMTSLGVPVTVAGGSIGKPPSHA